MSPLDAAFHDWADAHEGPQGRPTTGPLPRGATGAYDGFAGGWAARQAEVDGLEEQIARLRRFWGLKLEQSERDRDEALMKLSSALYERDAFRRQRDAVAGLLERARAGEGQQP